MTKTFKALSVLLTYPTAELQQAAGAISEAIDTETAIPARVRKQLQDLLTEIVGGDLYDLQERYVLLFDRTRSLSLYLFEHVHGESRDRGQAMIDLKALYQKSGLEMNAAELPDYLPLFLEFLSTRPRSEAADLLGQTAHIVSALAERLRKRHSDYEAVLRALVALASTSPNAGDVSALLTAPDPDVNDLVALDAAWEDEAVTFGPAASNSCKDGLIAKIRAGRRPAESMTASSHQPTQRS